MKLQRWKMPSKILEKMGRRKEVGVLNGDGMTKGQFSLSRRMM
jgi:hypothetical protein